MQSSNQSHIIQITRYITCAFSVRFPRTGFWTDIGDPPRGISLIQQYNIINDNTSNVKYIINSHNQIITYM